MKIKNKFNIEQKKPLTSDELKALKKKNDIVEEWDFRYNDKHELEIVKTGEHSMQEYINSFKNECGLTNMLKKMALGQPINAIEGWYGDISELPTDTLNTSDIERRLKEAEETLAKLKEETTKEAKTNE